MIIGLKNLNKDFKVKEKESFLKNLIWPKYKYVKAVDNITFSIEQGESVALLGPNGAGKTTTMKMLSGLIYPTSGEIKVLGFTPFDRKKDFLLKIGLVMGNKTGMDWDLTAIQSFELIARIYRMDKDTYKKRINELSEMLDVKDYLDQPIRKLSLGQRMKMEIMGAILHNPQVLFLDEPTIGLDIISKQNIREFLRQIQRDLNVTLLLTSHDMDDIEKVCDRVIVINHGKKVYDNSLENLMKKHSKDRYIKFVFKKLPERSSFGTGLEIVEEGSNYYTIRVDKPKMPDLMAKITKDYDIEDIDIISIPLEELIAGIYKVN